MRALLHRPFRPLSTSPGLPALSHDGLMENPRHQPSRYAVPVRVHVLLRRADDLLFTRRAPRLPGGGCWQLPGGHLEPGETVLGAAAREAWEEVGVRVPLTALQLVHLVHDHIPGRGARLALFFEATRWEGEPANREPELCTDLRWAPADAGSAPTPMVGYIAAALRDRGHPSGVTADGWNGL